MRCVRCNRPLKADNTTGIGPICARLRINEGGSRPARIHRLSRRPDGQQGYIIFEEGREVYVDLYPSGEARCGACRSDACDHITQVRAKESNLRKEVAAAAN